MRDHGTLKYKADFSTLYDDRTLVDKGYVDQYGVVKVTAGQDMSSGRMVYMSGGLAFYYDPADETLAGKPIGITKTAVLTNAEVEVQVSGIFHQNGLGLTADQKYFIGINGTLTTNPIGLKVVQQIGVSLDTNNLK